MVAAHPYEEPAYDIYPLKNAGHPFMMGRVGTWPTLEPARDVLKKIKTLLDRDALSYAGDLTSPFTASLSSEAVEPASLNWPKRPAPSSTLQATSNTMTPRKPSAKASSSLTAATSAPNFPS